MIKVTYQCSECGAVEQLSLARFGDPWSKDRPKGWLLLQLSDMPNPAWFCGDRCMNRFLKRHLPGL